MHSLSPSVNFETSFAEKLDDTNYLHWQ